MAEHTLTIGKAEKRKDARDKVTGAAQYVADIPMQALKHGALVRSKHHYAKINRIDFSGALKAPGVLKVLTDEDIPGHKIYGPLIQDQTPLALGVVRHLGEPIALVIADSTQQARDAAERVQVDYEVLQPVFDPQEALEEGAPQLHPDGNLVTHLEVGDGDVEKGFAGCDIVLEETFSVPRISPGYMEPENSVATWNADGSLTVWVSSQHPFTDQAEIAEILAMPIEQVRVKSAVIGGAFGGKEDSSLAILAALGARAIQGNLRIVNTRQESFLAHPKRHPAKISMKLGAKQDGSLQVLQARVYMDTGAFASYGPAVGVILTETIPGSYRIPNVQIETLVAYTNSPLSGAMRGFGSPQSHFAIESMIDMLAEKLDMPAIELRRKNVLQTGDKMFTQVQINQTADSLPLCLSKAEELLNEYARVPAAPGKLAGVGMALASQSMGLGAQVPDDSTHRLEWRPDGSVAVYLGAPDLGQGLATAVEQITAESLGLPFELVHTVPLDTLDSPNGNVTCASRMTYMAGNAVIEASRLLVQQLLAQAGELLDIPADKLSYANGVITLPNGEQVDAAEITSRVADQGGELKSEATFSFPYPEETTPQHLPIGMPHVIYVYGAQVARVEVDPQLGTVEVTHLAAIHDAGRVISKQGFEGQVEGGVATGLGYALYEQMPRKGEGWVDSFTEYLLATPKDMPKHYQSIILENPEASGPFGAKGVGEIPLVPTAPAIANAVKQATGVRVTSLPISPEDLIRQP